MTHETTHRASAHLQLMVRQNKGMLHVSYLAVRYGGDLALFMVHPVEFKVRHVQHGCKHLPDLRLRFLVHPNRVESGLHPPELLGVVYAIEGGAIALRKDLVRVHALQLEKGRIQSAQKSV